MKNTVLTLITAAAFIIAACGLSQKKATSINGNQNTQVTTPQAPPKPANGVYVPGNEELNAIKAKFADATLETLTLGHTVYIGACTNCHGTKNIYTYPEESWFEIIADMAPKARITPVEKDAVYKYVMAIKATQPK